MDRPGLDQLKECDLSIEMGSVASLHLEASGHRSEGRGKRASRSVFEARIRLESGLLTNDTGAMDFLGMARAIHDRPMAIEELNLRRSCIRDSDRIEKEPSARRRAAVLRAIARADVDVKTIGLCIGGRFEKIVVGHGRHSSRIASMDSRRERERVVFRSQLSDAGYARASMETNRSKT